MIVALGCLAALGCTSAPSTSAPPPVASSITATAPSAPDAPALAARERPFGELVEALSEPDGPFSSDNDVSNETSYLDVGPELAHRTAGGAYIGVGPEQNFTYIALTRPRVAFVIDIRRRNMLLHLLYRALFAEAVDRSHFVAMLLGRPYDEASAPGRDAPIDEVLASAVRRPRERAAFSAIHARLRELVAGFGVRLSASDERALDAIHRAFFDAELGIHFEMSPPSGRKYPSLGSLLTQTDPSGHPASFLASEEGFGVVRDLERAGRVIPVVGDFAGERALLGIASELRRLDVRLSTFYVSNVEQYLFAPAVWRAWTRNVAALPIDDESVFIRAYLDQGKRHPRQRAGQRTATWLQLIAQFEERARSGRYRTYWQLVSD